MKNIFFLLMTILVIKVAFPTLGEAMVELVMLVVNTLTTIIGGANTAAAGL